MAGVTSARDLGAPLEASISVRDRINKGEIPGATMYMSGPFIQKAPYPGTELFRWGVNGADDARGESPQARGRGRRVDQVDRSGSDDAGRSARGGRRSAPRGLMVVAHAHRPEEIRRGLAAGVDNFEHTGLSSAPEYPEDIIKAIRERDGGHEPRAAVLDADDRRPVELRVPARQPGAARRPGVARGAAAGRSSKDIRESVHASGPARRTSAPRRRAVRRWRENSSSSATPASTLLIGTDSGIPMKFHSGSTWRELDAWVNMLGVDPMTAIRAATYWPAVAMRR